MFSTSSWGFSLEPRAQPGDDRNLPQTGQVKFVPHEIKRETKSCLVLILGTLSKPVPDDLRGLSAS